MVLIRYNNSVLQNKSVSAGHNECDFSSLTPGRLYTVTVETWSGDLVSSVATHGSTCESDSSGTNTVSRVGCVFIGCVFFLSVPAAVENLRLDNAGTGDLTVTWSPAPGDVDHYEVCVCCPLHLSFIQFYLHQHTVMIISESCRPLVSRSLCTSTTLVFSLRRR